MNKRDLILSLLTPGAALPYIPAAFFLHFGPGYQHGPAAVQKHLDFFQATDMDFVKIQYELHYPAMPEIQRPQDWGRIPVYDKAFFAQPLGVVEGLIQAAGKDALVIVTLYSPFMCAGHFVPELRDRHMLENPQAVKVGMEAVTANVLTFVRECIRLGVDGFYASTQGGESHRFSDPAVFDELVRPYDLAVMDEINQRCPFNILHICDYHDSYADISRFVSYPGQVVNANLNLEQATLSPKQVAQMFSRPFMGGLERKGVLAYGTPEQIRQEVNGVLAEAPEKFILAADCTVPGETPWANLRLAVDLAHRAA